MNTYCQSHIHVLLGCSTNFLKVPQMRDCKTLTDNFYRNQDLTKVQENSDKIISYIKYVIFNFIIFQFLTPKSFIIRIDIHFPTTIYPKKPAIIFKNVTGDT